MIAARMMILRILWRLPAVLLRPQTKVPVSFLFLIVIQLMARLMTIPLQLLMIRYAALLHQKKRKMVIKSPDDSTPLLKPFPLPKYYRPDVETALETQKMTKETTSAFYSAIASAMLVYKRYPTRDDYIAVGRAITEKYCFFSQPIGTPYVSFCSIHLTKSACNYVQVYT